MAGWRTDNEDEGNFSLDSSGPSDLQCDFPPWCVGSTFAPPQLLIIDKLQLNFEPVGGCERILSSGYNVDYQDRSVTNTEEQIEAFLSSSAAPYVPCEVLRDQLDENAASQKLDVSQRKRYKGNLLEIVECLDGTLIMLFPCGNTGEQIGCTVCYQRDKGDWHPVRTSAPSAVGTETHEASWSVSPSLGQQILQLSAVSVDPYARDGFPRVLVAARTLYRVYFCMILPKVETVEFSSTFMTTFRGLVSHVAWNPHTKREAAVLLVNGEISIFNLPSWKSTELDKFSELKPNRILESPAYLLRVKSRELQSLSSQALEIVEAREQQDNPLDESGCIDELWQRCEFAWHPQILFVSGLRKVVQVDYRKKVEVFMTSPALAGYSVEPDVEVLVDVSTPVVHPGYNRFESKEGQIYAFCVRKWDCAYEFSVATDHLLFLFDSRRVGQPVLQWEHGMTEEPPNLLIMLEVSSSLLKNNELGTSQTYENGRGIVAFSCHTGDVEMFLYGSKVTSKAYVKRKRDTKGLDWDPATFAWEMPVKILPPHHRARDWKSSLGLSVLKINRPPDDRFRDCICGISLLSYDSVYPSRILSARGFSLFQFTGFGDILLQRYKSSQQPTSTSNGRRPNMLKEDGQTEGDMQLPNFYVFGALMKYIHTGSTFGYVEEGPVKERSLGITTDDGFKTRLKTALQLLTYPLSMFELSQSVLRSGLLPRTPFEVTFPSDLRSWVVRAAKTRSLLPPISTENFETEESGNRVNHVKCIPLPSYVEVQNVGLKSSTVDEVHIGEGQALRDENNLSSEPRPGEKPVSGHLLLQDACKYVRSVYEELSEKQKTGEISLKDDSWREAPVIIHEISVDTSTKASSDAHLTSTEKKRNLGEPFKEGECYKTARALCRQEGLCQFVSRRPLADEAKDGKDTFTRMDSEICSIKLSFANVDEEPLEEVLEAGEWAALRRLQSQLSEWQLSFKPYADVWMNERIRQ